MIRFVRLCIIFALDITYAPFLKADRLSCPIFYVFRAFFFNIRLFHMFPPENSQALFLRFFGAFRRTPSSPFFSDRTIFPRIPLSFQLLSPHSDSEIMPFCRQKKSTSHHDVLFEVFRDFSVLQGL